MKKFFLISIISFVSIITTAKAQRILSFTPHNAQVEHNGQVYGVTPVNMVPRYDYNGEPLNNVSYGSGIITSCDATGSDVIIVSITRMTEVIDQNNRRQITYDYSIDIQKVQYAQNNGTRYTNFNYGQSGGRLTIKRIGLSVLNGGGVVYN